MARASLAKSPHVSSDFPWVHFISQFDNMQDIWGGSGTATKGNIKKNTLQQKYNRINYEIKAFVFASLDCVPSISQEVNFAYIFELNMST